MFGGTELLLGALVTFVVQVLKKLSEKIGSHYTMALVVVLTFVAAWIWKSTEGLFSEEMLRSWGEIAAVQFSLWAVVVKYVMPKLGK